MHVLLVRLAFLLCWWVFTVELAFAVPQASPPTHGPLLEVFDAVLQRVVALRHLRPKGPIQRRVRNRQQIRVLLHDLLDEELSPGEWAIERKAMHKWGLLPTDFPLKTFVLDLLTEQAAGYYDPKRQMFFIADWLPHDLQKPIMAHELVHALQDQHYDLQGHFAPVKEHADLTLARKALVEGDALAVMLEYMLRPRGFSFDQLSHTDLIVQSGVSLFSEQFQVYHRAPLVLKEQLLFPYTYGLAFIKTALTQTDWMGLQQIYQHPPLSTEQIIHPEKFFSETPDHPYEVSLRLSERLFQESWHKLKRDVLGEFLLSVVLQQFLPETEAKQSAAGWRGDRYELFEHRASGQLILVSIITWDTPADAEEFFQSYTKLLGLKYPDWTMLPRADPTEYIWKRGQYRLVLSRRAQMVQIIEGVSATDLPHLQGLLQNIANVAVSPCD
jgi:hypothetical protein